MKKIRALKFDHISEVNVLIEILNHYKHYKGPKLDIDSQADILLNALYKIQKMFMEK